MQQRSARAGFTLAELLIVVAILAILVAVAIPVFGGVLSHSKETVCLSNRTSLTHELVYAQLGADTPLSVSALQALADGSGITCPSGGAYTVTAKGDGNRDISVQCRIHSQTISQQMHDDFQSLVKNWSDHQDEIKFQKNYLLREYYFKQNGGSWPILRVNGTDYYIQPFFAEGSENEDVWLFATAENKVGSNYNVPYVYDPVAGQWYYGSNGSGSVVFQSIADLHDHIQNDLTGMKKRKWLPLEDYQELPAGTV